MIFAFRERYPNCWTNRQFDKLSDRTPEHGLAPCPPDSKSSAILHLLLGITSSKRTHLPSPAIEKQQSTFFGGSKARRRAETACPKFKRQKNRFSRAGKALPACSYEPNTAFFSLVSAPHSPAGTSSRKAALDHEHQVSRP